MKEGKDIDLDYQRAQLFAEAEVSSNRLRELIKTYSEVNKEDILETDGFKLQVDKIESLDSATNLGELNRLTIESIFVQKNLEGLANKVLDSFGEGEEQLADLIRQTSKEVKLSNDLAYFALNNVNEFLELCDNALSGKSDKDVYSEEFLDKLGDYYYTTENFTNLFISFYMAYANVIEFIADTQNKTEGFRADTDYKSIRTTHRYDITEQGIKPNVLEEDHIIKVDLEKNVERVMDYLVDTGNKYAYNPFKVQVGELMYFRDLTSKFATFHRFRELITRQFVENILNKLPSSLYIGTLGYDAYFVIPKEDKETVPKTLEFKLYGINFKQNVGE